MTVRKDGQSGREWPDHPAAIEDLKPFNCPFSGKVMDWFQGGCPHFVFSFEMVNCEYLTVDRDFEKLALKHFHDSGYKVQKLPCPLEPWAEYDDGDETRELPSLDKVVPGLKLISYQYAVKPARVGVLCLALRKTCAEPRHVPRRKKW